MVLGDRDELIRALENLVENALKYGAAGKRVDITSRADRPRAAQPKRASRYATTVRASRRSICRGSPSASTGSMSTDSRAQGGTGLGLALVNMCSIATAAG